VPAIELAASNRERSVEYGLCEGILVCQGEGVVERA